MVKKSSKIKDLPKVERPREKLIKYGPEKISNSELLGILLGSGTKDTNVVDFSKNILKKFRKDNIKDITAKELMEIKGVGNAKATKIVACMELGKRLLKDNNGTVLRTAEDIWKACSDLWNKKKEYTRVFYLNARDEEINRDLLSIGTLNSSLVHPREVFEPAIKDHAAKVVIVHNHPSGKVSPSKDDIEITNRLVKSGNILDVKLEDHIIVSKNNFYSFKENKLI